MAGLPPKYLFSLTKLWDPSRTKFEVLKRIVTPWLGQSAPTPHVQHGRKSHDHCMWILLGERPSLLTHIAETERVLPPVLDDALAGSQDASGPMPLQRFKRTKLSGAVHVHATIVRIYD
jgi:hypothetical protein